MKRITMSGRMSFFAAVLFSAPLLQAQYTFTSLDLLSSNRGGIVGISGNNVVITFMDENLGTTSFFYNSGAYTIIDDSANYPETGALAIDGANVVGNVKDPSGHESHGFLYSGGVYTILTYPGSINTAATGISGSNVIGSYQDTNQISHGYLYNGSTYTTISYPGSRRTVLNGVSGSVLAGTYEDSSDITHGFIYSGGTYTAINYPGAVKTDVGGISGSNVVGVYQASAVGARVTGHAFMYSGGTYTSINYPGSLETAAVGISGTTVVGTYILSAGNNSSGRYTNFDTIPHGFTYSAGTYKAFDVPGARRTALVAISGSNIVGAYQDINFLYHGFLAVPSTKTLTLGTIPGFGSVPINTSVVGTLKITNTGNTPLTVSSITYPAGFSGSWTGALGPGSTENLAVTFTPTAVQSYSGNITVTSNATITTATAAVSGSGLAATGSSIEEIVAPSVPVTYTQWAKQNAVVAGTPAAMPQHDGVPNLLKYLYDISPSQSMTPSDQAAMAVVGIDKTASPGTKYLTLTYRKNALAMGLTVNVQTSTDLVNWSTVTPDLDQQTGTDDNGDPIMEVGVDASNTNQRFIRLNVTGQ